MKEKTIIGPHKKCMVGLLRSLFGRWKVVVYVGFDPNLSLLDVKEIIRKCEHHNSRVRKVAPNYLKMIT